MAESQFPDKRGHISSDSEPRNQQNGLDVSSSTITHSRNQLLSWQVGCLRPHPSYARLGIKVPASRLNALLEMGEDAFLFPLTVTSDGIVIDGYARLEVARLQGRATVECIQYDISEEEALRRLLLYHRPSPGLVPFVRIVMARDLAKSLRERALCHQRAGGRSKGTSKLTEAEKVDVRKEMAESAGVSVGTLSHALQLHQAADPEVFRALCNGEIKIYRAWRWSRESGICQRENLKLYRRYRGMDRVAEKLIAKQLKDLKPQRSREGQRNTASSREAVSRLAALAPDVLGSVGVFFIKTPVPILALSEDIAQRLGLLEEAPSCC